MKDFLASVGGFLIFIVIAVVLASLAGFFIHGGARLAAKVYPWLSVAFFISLTFTIIILIPLSLFKGAKGIAGTGMFIASYVFGLNLWVWGFLLTYLIWGGWAVFIGLCVVGVGVVPIAMLAALVNGLWSTLIQLVVLVVMTFGTRLWGMRLAESTEELAYETSGQMHGYTNDSYGGAITLGEEDYDVQYDEEESFEKDYDDSFEKESLEELRVDDMDDVEDKKYDAGVVASECPGCGKLWNLNVFRYSASPFECPICETEFTIAK